MPEENVQQLWGIGGLQNSVVGPPIVAAATIAPTHFIHKVTGATGIANITIPHAGFSGMIILITAAANVFAATGNIAVTLTASIGVPVLCFYSPADGKWYLK